MDEDKAAEILRLRTEAASCRACGLSANATQTVFGEGPVDADILFVGEQPGDQEDLAGRPFVGPAGLLFDKALDEAGVDRSRAYVTNAVKHFKFEPRGKLRLHKKPNAGEVDACRCWLFAEIQTLAPRLIVALGATAAQSLVGRPVADRRRPRKSSRGAGGTAGVRHRASVVAAAPARRSGAAGGLRRVRRRSPRHRRAGGAPRAGVVRTLSRSAGSASRKNRAPRRARAGCCRPCGSRAARPRTGDSRPERRAPSAPRP